MSYAQKPTLSEELQGRVGDAMGRLTKGLVFNLRLTWKLSAEALRRALFKPRSITILDIPAGTDRLQPARMSVIPKADAWPRPDRAGNTRPLP